MIVHVISLNCLLHNFESKGCWIGKDCWILKKDDYEA